ncbi:male-enhanced antigen 1 [Cephus cinctus]|uniref:Male-enhanced antigen 1 n=1 Tax=Cephus cinctus TaxID=211228 RepID=A0AAJ7CF37_CEPCN|nr:male-enhanced antigen 1 [Cephus cinctus]XP_015609097.1 male-enhanced antigen 1 [Cephus cinctus]XP_024947470.1 male-enhanced antigen 1 [Cephus cinctus]XP_024947471.1 male-enhanced antigen 1 [Cephus cinctus]
MSPEPSQEPMKENLNAPNLSLGVRAMNESDSEDEDIGAAGYMPLSQVPADSDPMLDDEDEEWISAPVNSNEILPGSSVDEPQEPSFETLQVWSSSCDRSNIDLDADKINQVKSAMASFTLPTTAIPEWANTVSEEQWKQQLIDRIKEMQNRDN